MSGRTRGSTRVERATGYNGIEDDSCTRPYRPDRGPNPNAPAPANGTTITTITTNIMGIIIMIIY